MSDNDKVTIWGGIPRFGTVPNVGQVIAGSDNGFVIYDSASDNTGVIYGPGIPTPDKNMELIEETVAGVTTKYYGFAGYCGSFYSTASQSNLAAVNLTSFDSSSLLYYTNVAGTPLTQLTVLNHGVYRLTGTLDFFCNEAKVPVSPVTQWSDIALEVYTGVWIKKNGTDVPWTKRPYKMIGDYSRLVVNIDYMLELAANDYIEIVWESASVNTILYNAGPDYPSALVNINLVR